MAAKRIDTVQIATGAGLIKIPWELSMQVRGRLVIAGHFSTVQEFSNKTSAPTVLDYEGKRALLDAVRVCMQEGSDDETRALLPLRNALRADLADST